MPQIVNIIIGIVSIIAHIIFVVIFNLVIFTDRAILPDGERIYHRSILDRLEVGGSNGILFFQILFGAISIVTGILMFFGIKNNVLKIVQIASTVASIITFIIIFLTASGIHPKYWFQYIDF